MRQQQSTQESSLLFLALWLRLRRAVQIAVQNVHTPRCAACPATGFVKKIRSQPTSPRLFFRGGYLDVLPCPALTPIGVQWSSSVTAIPAGNSASEKSPPHESRSLARAFRGARRPGFILCGAVNGRQSEEIGENHFCDAAPLARRYDR